MHCACAAFAGLREDLSLTTEDGPYETSSCFGWSGTKHTALKTKLNRLIYGIMRYNPPTMGNRTQCIPNCCVFISCWHTFLAVYGSPVQGTMLRGRGWVSSPDANQRHVSLAALSRPGVYPSPLPLPPSFAIILQYRGFTSEGKNNDKSAFNLCVRPFCKTTLMVLVLIGSAGTILALSSH